MMDLFTEPYTTQEARWPASGGHILAQFDAGSVIVYQAYNPAIGHFAARHGYFGGGFGMGRMSWIKPNFPTYVPEVYGSEDAWRRAVAGSDVRLQWDHDPTGRPVERRAIQLGLLGEALAKYAKDWLLEVQDISDYVSEQRANAVAPHDRLMTPREEVYPVADIEVARRLGVSDGDE